MLVLVLVLKLEGGRGWDVREAENFDGKMLLLPVYVWFCCR